MAQVVTLIKDFPTAKYSVVKWGDQYVACWILHTKDERVPGNEISCHWEQGHYFSKIEDALIYAFDKEYEAIYQLVEMYTEEVKRGLNRLETKIDELGIEEGKKYRLTEI